MATIRTRCDKCGGSGSICQEIRLGDIVIPRDGSAMPWPYHKILAMWERPGCLGAVTGFHSVRIKAIEGNLLGVEPLNYQGEKHSDGISNCKVSFWGEGCANKLGEGFWIPVSHVRR